MYKTLAEYEWSKGPKNNSYNKRSEIEPVMQEIIAIIRTDLLRRPKNKKGRKTLPNVMVT